MRISDFIVEFLISKKITDVFGYPGGMVTYLMNSFDGYKSQIKAHTNYHEQASAFCACGYGQISQIPGVAFTTSGPGATNLITGICNAYFDSIPCIFITGQVNTYELKEDLDIRQKGFQETDIVSMVNKCTKYAVTIKDPNMIAFELEKAYYLCLQGRQGPVLLDIPMNIQKAEITLDNLPVFDPSYNCIDHEEEYLDRVVEMLNTHHRPCIILGSGVRRSGAIAEMRKLIQLLKIPVVTSMNAVDVLSDDCAFKYGFLGAYGDRCSNYIVAKSDLIISIGSRLDCRQIGREIKSFAPKAKLIRIDIDKGELSNEIKENEIQICQDVRGFLSKIDKILCQVTLKSYGNWIDICNQIKQKLLDYDFMSPNRIIRSISKIVEDYTVITTDVGQNQVWVAQSFYIKENQTILFSGGHGAMGYSLPAAIGAHYASNNKVICFCGDGGFQMNIQELQFIVREKLPIKIIILNNESLGMIRQFQEMYFESNYTQTIREKGYTVPDIKKIAYAYGLNYILIEEENEIHKHMLSDFNPAIIEIKFTEKTYVYPKLSIGKPNQDQDPAMNRDLYNYIEKL